MKTRLRRICSGNHEHARLEAGGSSQTGGAERYSEELADKLAQLMTADWTAEGEAALPHPRYVEEAYPAEDVAASDTASAATTSGTASARASEPAPAEARGIGFEEDSVDGWESEQVRSVWQWHGRHLGQPYPLVSA